MSTNAVVVQGIVHADGSLQLEGKVDLPPGKVQVTLRPMLDVPEGDPFFDMLKGIWSDRAAADVTPRSVEEVEAQRRQLRDESEQEVVDAGIIQHESEQLREQHRSQGEPD